MVKGDPESALKDHLNRATSHHNDIHVLALNSGSSSLKFGLFRTHGTEVHCLLAGEAENIGEATARFHAEDSQGLRVLCESAPIIDQRVAVARIGQLLIDCQAPSPQAIGHRIVHGGPQLRAHCLVNAVVLQQLAVATTFAPLHTPAALAVIGFAAEHFPGLPQVICLDTCFHARMPQVACTLPLPRELRAAGIQRYGFHGLSCESVVHQLAGELPTRLIIAHLGNGASITAIQSGISIDTSMGLTPTGGLIMSTRSGDLDPGVLVYLMRERKLDAAAIEDLVDHRCGLLGLSGISSDMRALHDAETSSSEARLAIDMFCYAAAKQVGAASIALGGIDKIVFTGGIGEHDSVVRATICSRLSCLGVDLDRERNQRGFGLVSSDTSRCAVQVLPSQEDEQIARHTQALCDKVFNAAAIGAPV